MTIPKPPWRERKLKYLEKMRSASPSVLRVSIADKLHNARCTLADFYQEGDTVWQKFKGGKNCFLWFYRRLLEIYQQDSSNFLKTELEEVICQLENHKKTPFPYQCHNLIKGKRKRTEGREE